jgi:hypothetical protein
MGQSQAQNIRRHARILVEKLKKVPNSEKQQGPGRELGLGLVILPQHRG